MRTQITSLPLQAIQTAAFSSDGRFLAVGGVGPSISVVESARVERIAELYDPANSPPDVNITWLSFLADGRQILALDDEGRLFTADIQTGERAPLALLPDPIALAALSNVQGRVAVADDRGVITLWHLSRGEVLGGLPCKRGVAHRALRMGFSPADDVLAVASGDSIHLWFEREGGSMRRLDGHRAAVVALAFSPDGRFIASGSLDGSVRVWLVTTGGELLVLRDPEGLATDVAFGADGSWLAAGTRAGGAGQMNRASVTVWKIGSPDRFITLPANKGRVNTVATSPDGTLLACGGEDPDLMIWNVRDVLDSI